MTYVDSVSVTRNLLNRGFSRSMHNKCVIWLLYLAECLQWGMITIRVM